jgi:hypothetical protein
VVARTLCPRASSVSAVGQTKDKIFRAPPTSDQLAEVRHDNARFAIFDDTSETSLVFAIAGSEKAM